MAAEAAPTQLWAPAPAPPIGQGSHLAAHLPSLCPCMRCAEPQLDEIRELSVLSKDAAEILWCGRPRRAFNARGRGAAE